jgi:hypothetical protein
VGVFVSPVVFSQSPVTTRRGNQLGGSFTLTMLGHTTVAIPFDAADTTMKAALEDLANVGTVRGRDGCRLPVVCVRVRVRG